jgi:hypothetical protein
MAEEEKPAEPPPSTMPQPTELDTITSGIEPANKTVARGN